MKLRIGGTRLVLVTENRAYKIARFRPLKPIVKIVMSVLNKKEFIRLYEKHGDSKFKVIIKSLLAGLLANRAEWRKWSDGHSNDFNPVLKIWLGGLVICQPRARRVTEQDILKSPLRHWYVEDEELSRPDQYGRLAGQIVLVDYAHLGLRW